MFGVLPPKLRRREPARRQPFRLRIRRAVKFAGLALLGASLAAVGVYTALSARRFARKSQFFKIETVQVRHASEGVEGEVRAAIGKLRELGEDNLLTLRTGLTRHRIEQLPRVRSARVEKRFPRTLVVTIDEREPLVAANAGELYWMDAEGFVLGAASPEEVVRSGAPILTGLRSARLSPGAPVKQPRLAEVLDAVRFLQGHDPALAQRFAEWHLNSEDEVVGVLRPGVEVRFGRHDPLTKLAALDAVLDSKPDIQGIQYFDLRFDSKVIYR